MTTVNEPPPSVPRLPLPTPEQVAANRAAWVAALRSGWYRQGTGALRTDSGYCCLGVAEHARGADWFVVTEDDGCDLDFDALDGVGDVYALTDRYAAIVDPGTGELVTYGDERPGQPDRFMLLGSNGTVGGVLTAAGAAWLGLHRTDPYVVRRDDYDHWVTVTLTMLNDAERLSFAAIAAVVEDQAADWDGTDTGALLERDRRAVSAS